MAETCMKKIGGSHYIRVPYEDFKRINFLPHEILIMTVSRQKNTVIIKRKG